MGVKKYAMNNEAIFKQLSIEKCCCILLDIVNSVGFCYLGSSLKNKCSLVFLSVADLVACLGGVHHG